MAGARAFVLNSSCVLRIHNSFWKERRSRMGVVNEWVENSTRKEGDSRHKERRRKKRDEATPRRICVWFCVWFCVFGLGRSSVMHGPSGRPRCCSVGEFVDARPRRNAAVEASTFAPHPHTLGSTPHHTTITTQAGSRQAGEFGPESERRRLSAAAAVAVDTHTCSRRRRAACCITHTHAS
jgi:ribosomal protein S8E